MEREETAKRGSAMEGGFCPHVIPSAKLLKDRLLVNFLQKQPRPLSNTMPCCEATCVDRNDCPNIWILPMWGLRPNFKKDSETGRRAMDDR